MEMNEPFAATIAAVVPVIWLVGALEVHQQLKGYLSSSQLLEETARRGEQMYKEAGDSPTVDQMIAIQKEMGDRLDDGVERLKLLPPTFLITLWTAVVMALVLAEGLALSWLAVDGAGPHPRWADFLLGSTVAGFVAVTVVPAAAAMVQTMRHLRRAKRRHAELRETTVRKVRDLQNQVRSQAGRSGE